MLLTAHNISKTYLMYDRPSARLWQMLWRGRRRFYTPFEALKPLSFTLAPGECVGVVGRNGSGKSTLLQLLTGTLNPSTGTIQREGRVAALLELGAGFNPDFTGRENLFLNASILGFSRAEAESVYAEIIEFAGLGEFIDRAVSTYSSGMVVRLAFAIATALRPDVLIVDEALSVGDEAFQRKCFQRIEAMRAAGTAILFVSHSAQSVIQLCDRALWLDKGELKMDATPKAVLDAYHQALNQESGIGIQDSGAVEGALPYSEAMQEYPPQGGRIVNPRLTDESGNPVAQLEQGKRYVFAYTLELSQAAENLRCGMLLKTHTGVEVAGAVLALADHGKPRAEAGERIEVTFTFTCLLYPGHYHLNCGVMGRVGAEDAYVHRLVDAFLIPVVNPAKVNRHGILPAGLVDLDVKGSFC